jgi:hypothetical protein
MFFRLVLYIHVLSQIIIDLYGNNVFVCYIKYFVDFVYKLITECFTVIAR